MATQQYRSTSILLLCALFWGSSFPASKLGLLELNPLTVVFCRFIIASLCLGMYIKHSKISFPHLNSAEWVWPIFVSLIGVGGFNLCLFIGLPHTNPVNGSLIMALSPIVTTGISTLMLRTFPSNLLLTSVIVCLLGVIFVVSEGDSKRLLEFDFNFGDRLIMIGMLAWSFYTYSVQSISRNIPVTIFTFIGILCSTCMLSIVILATPDIHPLTEIFNCSITAIASVLYISFFGTIVSYLLWLKGVKEIGASKASIFFNFIPVFSVLTSIAMGDTITLIQITGMFIIISGLLLPKLHPKYRS